jgi:hypothetical protein
MLCFLGFVQRYKVLAADSDGKLNLNHRLFASYLEYLRIVRHSSEGTIAEAITAVIHACHWLYRKETRRGDSLRSDCTELLARCCASRLGVWSTRSVDCSLLVS